VQTAAAQQQQSSLGQQEQRKVEDVSKQSKAAAGTSHNVDEVQRWALALSDEVTAAVDTADLNRRIFHFLTLCKQHIERTQVKFRPLFIQEFVFCSAAVISIVFLVFVTVSQYKRSYMLFYCAVTR
jgi:hypothetical protein